MKNTKYSFTSNLNHQPHSGPQVTAAPQVSKCEPKPIAPPPPGIRTTARDYANPVDYKHPYPTMAQFADLLALRYDANRTRHSYYRQLRLIHQHFNCDPSTITEAQLREYFLFVKLKKHWKPKSIRQALASAKVFFVELLGKPDWTIFSQIRAKDHDTLPAVLTRQQVQALLAHKGLRAATSGFTAVLHTWNQRLEFHPHIHCLVPGAGLNATGDYVRVRSDQFLVYLPHLQCAFRQHFYELLKEHDWQVDPQVWSKQWGVHIQPAGSGTAAVKYLGTYVARTAINDARLISVTSQAVTFRWKDRAHQNRSQLLTLPGIEFVRRYLRHVLPRGLRSVRYYGFCHPTAKASRLRMQLHSGKPLDLGLPALASHSQPDALPEQSAPLCPKCGQPMKLLLSINLCQRIRGPPRAKRAQLLASSAA